MTNAQAKAAELSDLLEDAVDPLDSYAVFDGELENDLVPAGAAIFNWFAEAYTPIIVGGKTHLPGTN